MNPRGWGLGLQYTSKMFVPVQAWCLLRVSKTQYISLLLGGHVLHIEAICYIITDVIWWALLAIGRWMLVDAKVLEETEENKKNKKCYFWISRISSRQATGFEKDKTLNIQEFWPGCSAMQPHYGLRLFFKSILTVQYTVCNIMIACYLSFD